MRKPNETTRKPTPQWGAGVGNVPSQSGVERFNTPIASRLGSSRCMARPERFLESQACPLRALKKAARACPGRLEDIDKHLAVLLRIQSKYKDKRQADEFRLRVQACFVLDPENSHPKPLYPKLSELPSTPQTCCREAWPFQTGSSEERAG